MSRPRPIPSPTILPVILIPTIHLCIVILVPLAGLLCIGCGLGDEASLPFSARVGVPGKSFDVEKVSFSNDGHSVVAFGRDIFQSTVCVWRWDLGTQHDIRSLGKHALGMYGAMALTPDQSLLVSGGTEGRTRMWDFATGNLVQEFVGRKAEIVDVCVACDGSMIACVSRDATIPVWSATTGEQVASIETKYQERSAVFDVTGRRIVSIGDATGIRLWDIDTGLQVRAIRTASYLYELELSSDGMTLCTGEHGIVRVFDFATGTQRHELDDDFTTIYDVAISPDCKLVASGGRSNDVYVWEIESGEKAHHFHMEQSVKSLAFSPDSERLVICGSPYWLHVIDLTTGHTLDAL